METGSGKEQICSGWLMSTGLWSRRRQKKGEMVNSFQHRSQFTDESSSLYAFQRKSRCEAWILVEEWWHNDLNHKNTPLAAPLNPIFDRKIHLISSWEVIGESSPIVALCLETSQHTDFRCGPNDLSKYSRGDPMVWCT